jgi:mannose-6-phosphate isomerase-like protein (cupin superfamily)
MSTNQVGTTYERPWGTYQTVSMGGNFQVKVIRVVPGGILSLQKHAQRSEHWVVVEGTPTITTNDVVQDYQVNQSVYIAVGDVHRLENRTEKPVAIIEVQVGDYLGEDDIVRLEDVYGRS